MEKSKTRIPSNGEIADVLEHIADLLETQDANPHRVRAYRDGANRARDLDRSLARMVMSGDGKSLQELPDIGEGLARVIARYVENGRSNVLDRLQGEVSPRVLFSQLPGIGPHLAERIIDQLELDTLEELEQAAHDGRLAEVDGFGPKRTQSLRVSLAGLESVRAAHGASTHRGNPIGRESTTGCRIPFGCGSGIPQQSQSGGTAQDRAKTL
jgi:DNA polymerase (family X)